VYDGYAGNWDWAVMPMVQTFPRKGVVPPARSRDALFTDETKAGVAYRLRLTREVLGFHQGDFAERAGLKINRYNQFEHGVNFPKIEAAIALCKVYRLSLDWIFRGDTSSLRRDLADSIDTAHKLRQHTFS
jgi:DNA-binding XRE family transcriptional regulator